MYLGLIFFFILVEENIGKSFWWEVLYIITLFKILSESFFRENHSDYMTLIFGSETSLEIFKLVMITVVLYTQKKNGFSSKNFYYFETPGKAIIRLVRNRDFESLLKRISEKNLKMIRGIAHYVKKKNRKSMNVDMFKELKTLCTTTLVNAYLVIDKYK